MAKKRDLIGVPCWHLVMMNPDEDSREVIGVFENYDIANDIMHEEMSSLMGEEVVYLEDGVIYRKKD
ncbi:hypothetical protein PQC39_gp062 [Vibrio phage Vp_R1]|uniref:Uncharacterized protein n=1 Tax=Vibrio phage Vp_R1 TaxID=2059867 RepID=A0A2H5BQJ6_9CAUD|nr:hypothetical protein PQC39_gp062 [Vibrio phage Vp_R1]AUG88426.1 hypothetical protein VPR_062 [Vibrio phage Vp_R1]